MIDKWGELLFWAIPIGIWFLAGAFWILSYNKPRYGGTVVRHHIYWDLPEGTVKVVYTIRAGGGGGSEKSIGD